MVKRIGRINELPVVQNSARSGSDAVALPNNCVKVTIKNLVDSQNTAYVSWNVSGSKINPLMPGESVTYWFDDMVLDGNELYVFFEESGTQGRAIVSTLADTLKENPNDPECK